MAGMRMQQLATLFRRVGTALQAGVDVLRVWEMERDRGSPRHREQMRRIYDHIRGGGTITEALRSSDQQFPRMALEMVHVGETTGHLEVVLLKLADHYEHLVRLRREFTNAMFLPMIQLLGAVAVVSLLIWIGGFLTNVDILGLGLAGTSGLISFLSMVIVVGGALAGLVYSLARGWWGSAPVAFAHRLPVIGRFLETMALSRFTWSLGVAIGVGMDARQCMRLAIRSTHNPVYLVRARAADAVLARHGEFHEAMEAAGVFPNELIEAVRNADVSGTHAEALAFQARYYEEQFKAAAKTLAFFASGAVRLMVMLLLIGLIMRLAGTYLGALSEAAKPI